MPTNTNRRQPHISPTIGIFALMGIAALGSFLPSGHSNYRLAGIPKLASIMKSVPIQNSSFKYRTTRTERHVQREAHQSVHAMGWIPLDYPDPQTNPDQCHLGKIVSDDQEEKGGEVEPPRLLFCDPDFILKDSAIVTISDALRNFTDSYSYSHGADEGETSVPFQTRHSKNQGINGISSLGERFRSDNIRIQPEIAVALAWKMDLPNILHDFAFYTFEDEGDMINDAAQYFASYLHNKWFRNHDESTKSNIQSDVISSDIHASNAALTANGILIFMSIADRICFISSGNGIAAVLPWWRLEKVVYGMKENMRLDDYDRAIIQAIRDISLMMEEGPPTASEKAADFFDRFGIVLLFSTATFFLAVLGEYRDRRKRYEDAEKVSEMDDVEREKASLLQRTFKTTSCPICLENFDNTVENESGSKQGMPRVDTYGIFRYGSDGEPLKMLRCGHVFDSSCWRHWITSGSCGDPRVCPVCRADIAKPRKKIGGSNYERSERSTQVESNYGTFGIPSDSDDELSLADPLREQSIFRHDGTGSESRSSAMTADLLFFP